MSRYPKKNDIPYPDPKLAHDVPGPVLTGATQEVSSEPLPREPGARAVVLDARSVTTERHRERAKELLSAAVTRDEINEAIHLAGLELASSELPTRHDDTIEEQRRKATLTHEANAKFLNDESFAKETARTVKHAEHMNRSNESLNKNIEFVSLQMKLTNAIRFLGGE